MNQPVRDATPDFAVFYAKCHSQELMLLKAEGAELVPEARAALDAELTRRGLDFASELAEMATAKAAGEAEIVAKNARKMKARLMWQRVWLIGCFGGFLVIIAIGKFKYEVMVSTLTQGAVLGVFLLLWKFITRLFRRPTPEA